MSYQGLAYGAPFTPGRAQVTGQQYGIPPVGSADLRCIDLRLTQPVRVLVRLFTSAPAVGEWLITEGNGYATSTRTLAAVAGGQSFETPVSSLVIQWHTTAAPAPTDICVAMAAPQWGGGPATTREQIL